jgi:hypothetical protein
MLHLCVVDREGIPHLLGRRWGLQSAGAILCHKRYKVVGELRYNSPEEIPVPPQAQKPPIRGANLMGGFCLFQSTTLDINQCVTLCAGFCTQSHRDTTRANQVVRWPAWLAWRVIPVPIRN